MPVNSNKPEKWKADIAQSVDFYNAWFMQYAPQTYRDTRMKTTAAVESALTATRNLTNISPDVLKKNPSVIQMLRMATAPPIARDRLIGLSKVSTTLIGSMELNNRIPPKMPPTLVDAQLRAIGQTIITLADQDIFPWLNTNKEPSHTDVHRAATIVADRLCGAMADPLIRNSQEQRQLMAIKGWLEKQGYTQIKAGEKVKFTEMKPGSFTFRLNVPVALSGGQKQVNIPVDAVIMSRSAKPNTYPLLVEAKSAGDFTNTNKRRKEEAIKITQLRNTYGPDIRFILFLSGYFDSGYLGYEAAEGIDWVWEHRIDDLTLFGLLRTPNDSDRIPTAKAPRTTGFAEESSCKKPTRPIRYAY